MPAWLHDAGAEVAMGGRTGRFGKRNENTYQRSKHGRAGPEGHPVDHRAQTLLQKVACVACVRAHVLNYTCDTKNQKRELSAALNVGLLRLFRNVNCCCLTIANNYCYSFQGGLQALEPMLLTAEKALMGDGQRRGPPFSLR